MSTPPSQSARRPSLPMIPIPLSTSAPRNGPPLTPIGYARTDASRRSSISSSLPTTGPFPFRRGSISSISSTSTSGFNTRDFDDGAIVEDESDFTFNPNTSQRREEGLSFARRMSFGARALGVVSRGPVSPVGSVGRGFFPDSERQSGALKDHLDGKRQRGMSLGAAQIPPMRAVDAQVQGKAKAVERSVDPFEERIVRGEMYMD